MADGRLKPPLWFQDHWAKIVKFAVSICVAVKSNLTQTLQGLWYEKVQAAVIATWCRETFKTQYFVQYCCTESDQHVWVKRRQSSLKEPNPEISMTSVALALSGGHYSHSYQWARRSGCDYVWTSILFTGHTTAFTRLQGYQWHQNNKST